MTWTYTSPPSVGLPDRNRVPTVAVLSSKIFDDIENKVVPRFNRRAYLNASADLDQTEIPAPLPATLRLRSNNKARRPIPPATKVQRESRLPLQDEWVFESTVSELAKINPTPKTMVDLGSGPSRALEIFMTSSGCRYSAVDSHIQMISTRIKAGANPHRNYHTPLFDLSLFSNYQFDLSFSRATLGWIINEEKRQQALSEHLRVSWRSLILNFDWSVATGGKAFNELRDSMAAVLRPIGFDPYYGAIQHAEVTSLARRNTKVETKVLRNISRRFRGVFLASAKGVLNLPSSPFKNNADEMIEEARQELDSGGKVSLPSIVATHCF